jgi:hypothetical protein
MQSCAPLDGVIGGEAGLIIVRQQCRHMALFGSLEIRQTYKYDF